MTKLYNCFKKIFAKNLNTSGGQTLVQALGQDNFSLDIKKPSNEVLKLARKFKNIDENNENTPSNDTFCTNVPMNIDDLYIQFKEYLTTCEARPSNTDIEARFGGERKRKELVRMAIEEGILIKNGVGTKLNPNL